MKSKQKRIVAVLVAANVILIVGLAVWVSRAFTNRPATPTGSVSTRIPSLPTTSSLGACQWEAVQLMARAGLDGAVTLTSDGTLRFDIFYPLAPGQTVDEAAQSIWPAFDIALALVEEECDFFTQVEVIVLAQGSLTGTRISARVSAADLIAFGAGELSEDEFAERVIYQVGDE